MTGFNKVMRFCNTLQDYESAKNQGTITDDLFVVILQDKLAKFKGQTFDWSQNADLTALATKGELEDLAEEIASNERVWAEALNDLNERINEIGTGGGGGGGTSDIVVDAALSTTSTNAIQNKAVANALNEKADASALASKQDTLVSGTNIKTVQGQSILGSGNISISIPTVDAELSSTSTNAVQNKVVKAEIDKLAERVSLSSELIIENAYINSQGIIVSVTNASVAVFRLPKTHITLYIPLSGNQYHSLYAFSNTANLEIGSALSNMQGSGNESDVQISIDCSEIPYTYIAVSFRPSHGVPCLYINSLDNIAYERSISAIALQDYSKQHRVTTQTESNIKEFIQELYILPQYYRDDLVYDIRPYNRGFIFGAYNAAETRIWACRQYDLDNEYTSGDIIPLTVDVTESDVNAGTIIGYIIVNDISALCTMPNAGIGEKIDKGLASQAFLNPKIMVMQNMALKDNGPSLINGVDVTLPNEIMAVEGDTLQIFWRSIVGAFNPYIFDIVATCPVGKSYPRYFSFTPSSSNVGNRYTLNVAIKGNDSSILVEKSVDIIVIAKAINPSSKKNILCIGASATAGGQWAGELNRRLSDSSGDGTPANPTGLGLDEIAFVGRKTGSVNPVHLEATGGWTVKDYATEGSKAVRFIVTDVDTLSLGSRYSHNGTTYVIQEVNVTNGAGNIRCTLESAFATPVSPYLLSKLSGNGDEQITFTSYEEEYFSPFWNAAESRIDFQKYADTYCDGHIDCLIWHCGVNDLVGGDPSVIPSVIGYFRQLLDAYHNQFPDGRVIISSVPIGSVNGGFAANYGANSNLNYFKFAKVVQKYAQSLDALCREDQYSSFVKYAPVLEEFDVENAYPTTPTPVNNRATKTEELGTNGVHPTAEGSYMVADAIYRTFNSLHFVESVEEIPILTNAEGIYMNKYGGIVATSSPRGVAVFQIEKGVSYNLIVPMTGNSFASIYAYTNTSEIVTGSICDYPTGEGNESEANLQITTMAGYSYLFVCYTTTGGLPTLFKA